MGVFEFGEGKGQFETSVLVKKNTDGTLHFDSYAGAPSVDADGAIITSFKLWLTDPETPRNFFTGKRSVVTLTGRLAAEGFFKLLFQEMAYRGRPLTKTTKFVIAEPAFGVKERAAYEGAVRSAVAAAAERDVEVTFFREPDAVFTSFLARRESHAIGPGKNVLVVDAGGGTCNVSVVTTTEAGTLWRRSLAVPVFAEAPRAGGSVVDHGLLYEALNQSPFRDLIAAQEKGKDKSAYLAARDRWIQLNLGAIERAKVEASTAGSSRVRLPVEGEFAATVGARGTVEFSLDRRVLEEQSDVLWSARDLRTKVATVLKTLHDRLTRVARRKGLPSDPRKLVNLIILTGGTSRLPGFRKRLEEYFAGVEVPIEYLQDTAPFAVVEGLRALYSELSERTALEDGPKPAVASRPAFLPEYPEDLALFWDQRLQAGPVGLVYKSSEGPLAYHYGADTVPPLRAVLPPSPELRKFSSAKSHAFRAQVCPASETPPLEEFSPRRLNLLDDCQQISVPLGLKEVSVKTSIDLPDGHAPQLVLEFTAAGKSVARWPLPYLGQLESSAAEEDADDVLFIDFGTSATRVIDLRGERRPRAPAQPAPRARPTEAPMVMQPQPPAPPPPQAAPPPAPAPVAPPPSPPSAFPHPTGGEENTLSEKEYVQYLEQYCEQSGLVVEPGLIKNLYLSLKVRPLVVLAGPPGVGKSSVATCLAEAMGSSFEPDRDSLRIAVEANWTDGRFLFWQRHGHGEPEPSRFQELLRYLEKNEAKRPHHVLFDEMNLAHVEYYFAQLLSAFPADGVVTIPGAPANRAHLKLPHGKRRAELALLGTINIDETTHILSDKVLDRCNLVEVGMTPIPKSYATPKPPKVKFVTVEQLRAWRTPPPALEPSADLSEILEALASETTTSRSEHEQGRGIFLGHRLVKDVTLFCHFAQQLGVPEKEALDWQVRQLILPRIHGDRRLTHALTRLDEVLEKKGLTHSKNRLQRLLTALADGFVTFWA